MSKTLSLHFYSYQTLSFQGFKKAIGEINVYCGFLTRALHTHWSPKEYTMSVYGKNKLICIYLSRLHVKSKEIVKVIEKEQHKSRIKTKDVERVTSNSILCHVKRRAFHFSMRVVKFR